nr:hypothetical protein C1892_01160 [Pseudomonas sp. MPBD7-1]
MQVTQGRALPLWRGSLLPLGCAAALKPGTSECQAASNQALGVASPPSGSKLPRHSGSNTPEVIRRP